MPANAATPPLPVNVPPLRRKRRVALRLLLTILVGAILWVSISDGPVAEAVRELVGVKQDRAIVDATFSVGAHTFRYYKFSLPEGTMNVLRIVSCGQRARHVAMRASVSSAWAGRRMRFNTDALPC